MAVESCFVTRCTTFTNIIIIIFKVSKNEKKNNWESLLLNMDKLSIEFRWYKPFLGFLPCGDLRLGLDLPTREKGICTFLKNWE